MAQVLENAMSMPYSLWRRVTGTKVRSGNRVSPFLSSGSVPRGVRGNTFVLC